MPNKAQATGSNRTLKKMIASNPQCTWIALPFKDKRRGSMWLCKWCRLMRKATKQPECPINIDQISTKLKG